MQTEYEIREYFTISETLRPSENMRYGAAQAAEILALTPSRVDALNCLSSAPKCVNTPLKAWGIPE